MDESEQQLEQLRLAREEQQRELLYRADDDIAALPDWFRWVIGIGVLLFLLSIIIFAVWLCVWPLTVLFVWDVISARMESGFGRFIGISIFLVLAVTLYWGRRKIPGLYGVAEVSIGLAVCWTTLGHTSVSRREATLALAASIYIMVRGIDNMVVGLPPLWETIRLFLPLPLTAKRRNSASEDI